MKLQAVCAAFLFWIVAAIFYYSLGMSLRDVMLFVGPVALMLSPGVIGYAMLVAYREGQWSHKEEDAAPPLRWRRPHLRRVK